MTDEQPTESVEEIDAQLDAVADSIAAETSVRPEKDGGVTLEGAGQNGRYMTAEEYRAELTKCTVAEVPNPSIGQPTTPEPSAPAPGPSTPVTPQPSAPAPAPSASTPSTPAVPAPSSPTPGGSGTSTPSKTLPQTIASTGTSATWVAVGAVAVLVAGIGALVASRRAKN